MRIYEVLFICRPDTPEEEIDRIVAQLGEAATAMGGRVDKAEKWGKRRLAYRIAKQREGSYILLVVHGQKGEMVKELERRLKVTDAVIKYLSIRVDEEWKRMDKLRQRRERRAARRPRRPAPAAAPPAGSAAAEAAPGS
jgi:small subunit ribosomal protein S6